LDLSKKKLIIWDWNGTLLDDVGICVNCMNQLLSERNIQQLTADYYREIFTFPVKAYYQKAGFDFQKEDFEKPAMEFITLYYQRLPEAGLFPCVQDVLSAFQKKGLRQLVLSAMEHEKLEQSLKSKGIFPYFQRVAGMSDHYAHSKLQIGKDLLVGETTFERGEMVLIGDTLHDLEVAGDLGIDCVLVARGHQSKERLLKETKWVFNQLTDVAELVG